MEPPENDIILVKKLKKNDVSSFDLIYEKYHKKVYYFAFGFLKNKEDAEEVTQEVFLNLWRSREQISEQYVFSRYLFKIAYNTVHKLFRKHQSDRNHMEEALKDLVLEDDTTRIDIEYHNLLENTNRYIDKLPPGQKRIFLLSFHNQLTNEEIARRLKVSKKTVDNSLSKARSFLKKSLSDKRLLTLLFICLFLY